MLTLKYLLKSVRLQHAYGERPPGHINHDRACIEGPEFSGGAITNLCDRTENIALADSSDVTSSASSENISIYIGADSESGEMRLMID